jgi:hypothetical protein
MRISVKGLAKFMTSGAASQRKILHDFKFPNPEGGIQAAYYSEARRAIAAFHSSENDPAVIAEEVENLRDKAYQAAGRSRTRLEHNIRALQSYLRNFGREKFKVLATPNLSLSHGHLVVGATPDLCVRRDGRRTLIKLDLGVKEPDAKHINIILQVIFDAAVASGLTLQPKDVIYLDVPRANAHQGAKIRARLRTEIEATCENIEALWPTIK